MSVVCVCSSEQVLVSFPHSGGSRPSPREPCSSSEGRCSGTRAGSSWPSTLTLLDSIMPVLAWNLTVFNLARSFFSTLENKKHNSFHYLLLEVTTLLALEQLGIRRVTGTFSCLGWPQSARSLHEAWRASPATTRHQKHLWREGYHHKWNSILGWAGSCLLFGRTQTELYKNIKLTLLYISWLEFLCKSFTDTKINLLCSVPSRPVAISKK